MDRTKKEWLRTFRTQEKVKVWTLSKSCENGHYSYTSGKNNRMHIFLSFSVFFFDCCYTTMKGFLKNVPFPKCFATKKTWFLWPPAKFAEADVFVWITGKTTLMVEMSQKNNIVVTSSEGRWKMIEIKLELFQTCKKPKPDILHNV